ncbi:MAG: hypothetical protein M0Q21_10900 [Ignavibacteriaceae bacterium]|nr:hypothetical protein [Ignavibacteriaceae bacterium]
MKTILFILLLIFPLSLTAQENDSTFSHYGLIMDFDYAIANAFGFKYRMSTSTAFFIKGGFSSEVIRLGFSKGISVNEIDEYGGKLGIEYTLLSVDNISFYVVSAGGLYIHTYSRPYYSDHTQFIEGTRKTKNAEYTFELGFGVEYFISRHLSIGGSQTISLNYFKDNIFDAYDKPFTATQTKFKIADGKLTLSFYF